MGKGNKNSSNISRYGKMVSIASYLTLCDLFWKELSEFEQMAFKGYAKTSKESFLSALNGTKIGNRLMEKIIRVSKTFNWRSKVGKKWEKSIKNQVDFAIERFYEFCLDRSGVSLTHFWKSTVTPESIPDLVFKPKSYLKHFAKIAKKNGEVKAILATLSRKSMRKNLPKLLKSPIFKNCLQLGLLSQKELEEYIFHMAHLTKKALKNA